MEILIRQYTKDRIKDVLDFEHKLRAEENFWGWEIDNAYISAVEKSFEQEEFMNALSLLAYHENQVVGRIDCSLIVSHFDGSKKLIWTGYA